MSKKILVVDDDEDSLKITCNILSAKGNYEVNTLLDSSLAMDTIKADKPDLVILDIMMPKVNGFMLTKQIREDSSLASTKIIVYSAKIFEVDKKKAISLGADAYITKLLESDKLIETVKQLLTA